MRGSEFANSIVDKEDLLRIHQILEQYAGANLDFADASIMALAEKFDVRLLLTLDQRDFRMVRPAHCDHFDILP
ncbi:MAG: hypothetical protein JXB47_06240 [Anaerolineae bacterium]|nr:hypothetical protein [Anaerolineae bacterium]